MDRPLQVIIIDDEPLARSLLRKHLEEVDDVEIVGEFENGFDGLKGINELKPDLVMLDIHMPKLNGFEMLELLDEMPTVIFTTAYDQYAIKAFESNAIDYLLKPYSHDRLKSAIAKARKLIKDPVEKKQLKAFVRQQDEHHELIDRVAVKTGTKINIIYVDDIRYVESDDDYVMIYTAEGRFLKQKTMKFFEKHLPPDSFIRVHRSYIVRVDFVKQIELYEKESYVIKLKNDQTIPVSKSGYNRLRRSLNF